MATGLTPSITHPDGAPYGKTGSAPLAIDCAGLLRHYGANRVIDSFSLSIPQGSLVALLGESGCGKTTFLRLLAGFDMPDAGTIQIAGRPVVGQGTFMPPEARRVGIVFQDYALFPHLTVAENIAYGLNRGALRSARVSEVLELVGMQGMAQRMPHELSGGQQQRVALARALAPEPDVVLLDEPFSNLDVTLRTRLRIEVRDILRRTGITAILVTHDQEEALSLADFVAVMRNGRIEQMAPPDVVYSFPVNRAIAEFVGDANIIPGTADGHTVACNVGKLPLPLCRFARGAVDVMIRPEWFAVTADPAGEAIIRERMFYGHDQMLIIQTRDGQILRVRTEPDTTLHIGTRVSLSVHKPVLAYPGQG
ncbi:MAG: ABC transporter ATP-binding protein [Anaerolineae bacterium]|nr:ABC transporter ATP-binding protein [Anaerolineae bacterium]